MHECVIAGAGISGLALSWELKKRGISSLVLEAAARPGGKLFSERVDGYLCEWGPASFRDSDERVSGLIHDMALDAQLLRAGPASRHRGVVVHGKVVTVPTSRRAFITSPLLPLAAKLRAVGDLLLPRGPAARGGDESLAVMARRRLGRQGAERLLFPLTSGIYAGDLERISAPSALGWLTDLERKHRSLLLGLENTYQEEERVGGTLVSFQNGAEELTRALAGRLEVNCMAGVESLRREGATWKLAVAGPQGSQVIESKTVALAMPAPQAADVLAELDPALAGTVRSIEYVRLALVELGYVAADLPYKLDTYGFLVPPSEAGSVLGAVFPSAFFPLRAPDGHALIMVRVGGARHAELIDQPDEKLIELAASELVKVMDVQIKPAFARVFRHPQALPQYHLGHRDRVATIDDAEQQHQGLYLTGNAYRGLGVADCIHNAVSLAERIAAKLHGAN